MNEMPGGETRQAFARWNPEIPGFPVFCRIGEKRYVFKRVYVFLKNKCVSSFGIFWEFWFLEF